MQKLRNSFGLLIFITLISLPAFGAGDSPACEGSTPIIRFRLMVEPAQSGPPSGTKEASKSPALPVNAINVLAPDEKLIYKPLHIPDAIKEKAKITVLLAPTPEAKSQHIVVLEEQPAKDSAEWKVPLRASLVGVVFGPRGLSVKKVSSLVNQDDELVAELADYAQQTETVQALIQTLSQYEQSPSPGKDLNAALQGFSSQYNVDVPKLDAAAPTSQQASTLLRAVLPSLSAYDPLSSGRPATVQQTTGLAASVASLFFGSPVGLAAGGTALLTNLHAIVSPDTEFRAAFTQPVAADGLALCAKPATKKSHTRAAYLWMLRVPNAPPPAVSLPHSADLPLASSSTLEVECAAPSQLKLLPRARDWHLVSSAHEEPIPAKVEVGAERDALNLDLHKVNLPPGEYHLAAKWDWTPFQVTGTVRLHQLGDFSKVKLTPDSADRLVAGTGPVNIQLTGTDFEFVRGVTIQPAGDKDATPKAITFSLPKADQSADGEASMLEAKIDTSSLRPGAYLLRIAQTGDGSHDVPITVHPPDPTLTDLPLRVNMDEAQQTVKLRGTSLERISAISSEDAEWQLAPVFSRSSGLTERKATVKLSPHVKKGEELGADLTVEGIQKPLAVSNVLVVAGPRPRIAEAKASFSQESDVELRAGEVASGSPVSFAISTQNVDAQPALVLACSDPDQTRQAVTLHPGDKSHGVELDPAGEGILFLSLDPGSIGQSGCALTATLSTPDAGDSAPYTLGQVVRLPHIKTFSLSDTKATGTLYLGSLSGEDLQIIAKTGWNAQTGYPVQGIPTPSSTDPGMQTLKIELPWPPPSPRAPLYIWLRGETTGRKTGARY